MDTSFIVAMAVVHAVVTTSMTITNIVNVNRRLAKSSTRDTRRLRAVLSAELSVLKNNYASNVSAIYEQKTVIMSSRAFMAIYRAHLGKLSTLGECEIPVVVRAYTFGEIIEGFLAAHAKSNGQSSYSLAKDRSCANELIALFHNGIQLVDEAIAAIVAANGVGETSLLGASDGVVEPAGQAEASPAAA